MNRPGWRGPGWREYANLDDLAVAVATLGLDPVLGLDPGVAVALDRYGQTWLLRSDPPGVGPLPLSAPAEQFGHVYAATLAGLHVRDWKRAVLATAHAPRRTRVRVVDGDRPPGREPHGGVVVGVEWRP